MLLEYHSTIKRNKLIHATTWMNLKEIILNETVNHKILYTLRFYLYNIIKMAKL